MHYFEKFPFYCNAFFLLQLTPEEVNFFPDFEYDHSLSKPSGGLTLSIRDNDEEETDEKQCYQECVKHVDEQYLICAPNSREEYANLTLTNVLNFISDNKSFFLSIIQGSYSKSWRHKLFVHILKFKSIGKIFNALDTVFGLYSLLV